MYPKHLNVVDHVGKFITQHLYAKSPGYAFGVDLGSENVYTYKRISGTSASGLDGRHLKIRCRPTSDIDGLLFIELGASKTYT